MQFLVNLAYIQVIQLSKLTLAVEISSKLKSTPKALSFNFLIALRLIYPNLLCNSSIVLLFNTNCLLLLEIISKLELFSKLELLSNSIALSISRLSSRLDSSRSSKLLLLIVFKVV